MVVGDDVSTAENLEQEYLPLDPALTRAILSDYDVSDSEQLQKLLSQLDALKASALAEEASTFEPSSTSDGVTGSRIEPDGSSGDVEACADSARSTSNETEVTNTSDRLSSSDFLDAAETTEAIGELDGLGIAEKQTRLGELFPTQPAHAIASTLRRCDDNFGRALDVLLNHVHFGETNGINGEERVRHKSVDAFDQAFMANARRNKGKRKGRRVDIDDSKSSSETLHTSARHGHNHWKTAKADVDFISSKTKLPSKKVQSLYNKNGASVKATISAILDQHLQDAQPIEQVDEDVAMKVAGLASEFSMLSIEHAAALIQITSPSTAHAHELAKAMSKPRWSSPRAPERIVAQYVPVQVERMQHVQPDDVGYSSSPGLSASRIAALRSNAFSSTSTSHRKAGSDRLFGGVAAYYGQLGRDYHAQFRVASAAEADALVASKSTWDSLDLHGVSVADAVRIAEREVSRWWQQVRLKEARSMSERIGRGFVIVTGRGAHSKDGRGKIGPAVVRCLVGAGWKVEVANGTVTVRGKSR